ncbi:MAG: alpha-amylase family glycosyl hydrolase, partial [Woeseiaceae bacterium]|nr:alpha-amylase family glycosyl hydrolase [Woeseiaceae bacterium]
MRLPRLFLLPAALLAACGADEPAAPVAQYYGTLEPFAAEAVYFIVTDRFVDGDPANNHEDQGGELLHTFDRPVQVAGQPPGNIGYLGGDFQGVIDNAAYIAEMGFTAVWLTPVVDNPDEAFTGGAAPGEGGSNDRGKAGYHGYWGVNFFELDEHLPSPGLDYAALTERLRDEHGLGTILDVVCNHGSPAFTMPEDQPKFGELYDAAGTLVADHQNLLPSELSDDEPLHAFFRRERDLAELADLDHDNPDVLDYCASAHLGWIGQGAAAVRIDTIKHMPHRFWKAFADRIRAE